LSYRFGFGGQERDNEIYGSGNSYTAEYWQYDSRLGRRWNVDPVDQIGISNYATFRNNPILYIDQDGLAPGKFKDKLRKIFTPAKYSHALVKHDKRSESLKFSGKTKGYPSKGAFSFSAEDGTTIDMNRSNFYNLDVTTSRRSNPSDPLSNTLNSWINYFQTQDKLQSNQITLNSAFFGISMAHDGLPTSPISYQFLIDGIDFSSFIAFNGFTNSLIDLNESFHVFMLTTMTGIPNIDGKSRLQIVQPCAHQIKLTLTAKFQGDYKYLEFRRLNGEGRDIGREPIEILAPWKFGFGGGAAPWQGGYMFLPKMYRQSRMYQLED
jgi:RHS repeat-associated protein